jgi:hypothetical protein
MTVMKLIFFIIFSSLVGCSTFEEGLHPSGLDIKEINPNKWTSITKQNLLHLTQVYDLTPVLFTKKIQIQSQIIPSSHPVLSLNTKYAESPDKILAIFLHEQFHWWILKNQIRTNLAIIELKALYPKAPQTQSSGKDSTYIHIIVCYLEYAALKYYIGRPKAHNVIREFIKKEKLYPWIFSEILKNEVKIKNIIHKQGLNLPPLS